VGGGKGSLEQFECLWATVTQRKMAVLCKAAGKLGLKQIIPWLWEFGVVYRGFFAIHIGQPVSDPCV